MELALSEGCYELLYLFYVLDAWLDFKARVDVEAEAFLVMKLPKLLCILRADASRKQEGQLASVAGEDVPVELLAASSMRRALGVEEKKGHRPTPTLP